MGSGDDPPPTTGPPDRQTLRLLERLLTGDPLVAVTEFDPDSSMPQLLRAHLDSDRYPPAVTAARLDVRWFSTGDFSLHHRECGDTDTQWECRWDRHPNSHNTRVHFHRPPDGTTVEDLTLPALHPIDVISTVLTAVERRIERQWSADR